MLTVAAVFAIGLFVGLAVGQHIYRERPDVATYSDGVPPMENSWGPWPRGQASPPNAPPIPTSDRRPTSTPPVEPHRTVTLRIVDAREGQPNHITEGEDY